MPAQHLAERTRTKIVSHVNLPNNASSQALVKRQGVLDEVEFRTPATSSGKVTTQQWLTVTILVYVNLINYMDRLTLAGILSDVKAEFNANDAMGGLLQTAFIVSYMVFAPLFGYLGDRYSRRAIMAAGVFLWSVFTLIGSFMSGRPEHRPLQWGNPDYWAFLGCRAMVGIGEASYSTIAPTIISDLFIKEMRSRMLALFYFAIPVGSGLGYIVGSYTAQLAGSWQWGLRVTPIAGVVAVLLIMVFLQDPPRGESEGHEHLQAATYREDIVSLARNKSFVFSTLAFTCVTFCTGALSWWGPTYIVKGLMTMEEEDRGIHVENVSLVFGAITMMSGIVGVPCGMLLSTHLKARYPRADPLICAGGILLSALFLTVGMCVVHVNVFAAFMFLFLGEVTLNLNWSIVADILLYVVVPTCRSTAEAIQILASHTFGDAGSPYLIGLVSDGLREMLRLSGSVCVVNDTDVAHTELLNATVQDRGLNVTVVDDSDPCSVDNYYSALQYSLFINSGVEVMGGVLFLVTAVFIVKDKLACEVSSVSAVGDQAAPKSETKIMLTHYSLESSLGDELPSDDEEVPKLHLISERSKSSSRSSSPL